MKSPLVMLAINQLMKKKQIFIKKLNRVKVGYITTKRDVALLLCTMTQILELADKKKKFGNLQDYVYHKNALYIYSELPKRLINEK